MVDCEYLRNYMIGKGYWVETTNTSDCQIGDAIELYNYAGVPYHVMLITYWDGTTMEYNAHTSDRYHKVCSPDSRWHYFKVSCVTY